MRDDESQNVYELLAFVIDHVFRKEDVISIYFIFFGIDHWKIILT